MNQTDPPITLAIGQIVLLSVVSAMVVVTPFLLEFPAEYALLFYGVAAILTVFAFVRNFQLNKQQVPTVARY